MASSLDPRPVPTAQNDNLLGTAGNDILSGYDGHDSLSGGAGDDVFEEGLHRWEENAGIFQAGTTYDMGEGNDTFRGGAGYDILTVWGQEKGVVMDAAAGTLEHGAETDVFSEIEGFILTDLGDSVVGLQADMGVLGLDGKDTVVGLAARVYLAGGWGIDLLDLRNETAATTIHLDGQLSSKGAEIHGFEVILGALGFVNDLNGTLRDETLTGGARADSLAGWGGNDQLVGAGGNDQLAGGTGDDRLTGGAGADHLDGGLGSNHIDAGDGADVILVAGWQDYPDYQYGHDTVLAGDGSDTIQGGRGTAEVFGGRGDDSVRGETGRLIAELGLGNDTGWIARGSLMGGVGNDVLSAGFVTIQGGYYGGGTVELLGGAGEDFLVVAGPDRATLDGGTGNDTLQVDTGFSPDHAELFGGAGDDVFRIRGGSDLTIAGGAGFDTYDIQGGARITDTGEASSLIMSAYAGVTYLASDFAETVEIGIGSAGGLAYLDATLAGGNDAVLVGAGVGFRGSVSGDAGDDTILGFSHGTLTGGDGNDVLSGANGGSITSLGQIAGGVGDDLITFDGQIRIDGGRGNDTILALGSGSSHSWLDVNEADIIGGPGMDTAVLGAGSFAIYASDATPEPTRVRDVLGVEVIQIGVGATWIDDYLGMDMNLGSGADRISAHVAGHTYNLGTGNDTSTGNVEGTIVYGEGGNDWLSAGLGEIAYGGDGNDVLQAASGAALFGGDGTDILELHYTQPLPDHVTLDGGLGDDYLNIYWGSALVVEGGQGNDGMRLGWWVQAVANLGSGDDVLDLAQGGQSTLDLRLGDGADRISSDDSNEAIDLTVRDFDPTQDRLALAGVASLADIDMVQDAGPGVTLTEGELSLTLLGVTAAQLTSDVFL